MSARVTADDSKGHAWIRRTLVPPSFFKRAITCRLRADQPPYVLLVSDSGFDVWRGGVDEDAPDAAMDCEGEGEAPPYLTHVDYWEMREEISAIDVLHDGDGDVIITGSAHLSPPPLCFALSPLLRLIPCGLWTVRAGRLPG